MFYKKIVVLITCLFIFTALAFGDSESISAEKDGTLYQSETGNSANSRGQNIFVGNTNNGAARRALLFFDVAANIPAGSTITSVQLTLNMNKTISGGQDITLHKVQSNWGEGSSDAGGNEGGGTTATTDDATWLHTFFNTGQWTNPGGDFESTVSAITNVSGTGDYNWGSTSEMVSDVQSWLDNPGSNFGWIMIGNESASGTSKRFASRENSNSEVRPRVLIEFQTAVIEKNERLYFAQFADGGGIFSQITLINSNQSEANVDVMINDREGQPFSVDLNTQVVNGMTSLKIPAGGIRQLATDGNGTLTVGSVIVKSDQKLSGVVLFGGSVGLAGVGSSESLSNGFTAPIESNSTLEVNTGIAIMNLEDTEATVTVKLFDTDGLLLASAEIKIPANGQRALFVSEIEWDQAVDLSNFLGVLGAESTSKLGATVVQTRPDQFATMPVNAGEGGSQ